MMLKQLIAGILMGAAVAAVAWRYGALNGGGAFSAALLGGLLFGLGGIPWAGVLLAFFLSSSLLSRLFSSHKKGLHEKFAKGSRRDAAQVFANGGLGALLVILQSLLPQQRWPWMAFAGAMAAVNADTWATELGVLSRGLPRLITSGKPVERGTSGGVSREGLLASLMGAAFIAAVSVAFSPQGGVLIPLGWITLAGFSASLFDSLLGATVQRIYTCPTCQKETERHPHHTCGTPTQPLRGWRWLDNDGVNTAASLLGGLIASGGWWIFALMG